MVKSLTLVNCDEQYWPVVLELRNDPANIAGFQQQADIPWADHEAFMKKYSHGYRICLADGVPAGFVGVVNNDIRVATKPEFKKMGIGKFMINEIMKIYPNAIAMIKAENTASRRLFESCGFKDTFVICEHKI